MGVKKLASGEWQLDFYPNGRAAGKRHRKKFMTKGEALAFERHHLDQAAAKPWLGDTEDKRTLKDLIDKWYDLHGVTLDDGKRRQQAMHHAYECMGKPLATEFSAKMFGSYREKRLKGEFPRSKRVAVVSPRTMNLELAYFLACFNELSRLEEWKGENPLKNIRAFTTDESEMAYLTTEEIEKLLYYCEEVGGRNLINVVTVCLSTGARWSEAQNLTRTQINPGKITYTKTKGKRNRTVPISHELYEQLPKNRGRVFTECYAAFRIAIKRSGIELPAGQLSHVLRHTFASHFMMNGGNILVLQRILGHTDIKLTMRYAHFSPDHLEEALHFNPMAKIASKLPQQNGNTE
ncbi:phage integrase [Rahnella aceris]|uniref:phage integrase n=1 Tax=Rahnella sp. (strain Y9602) TaxID=2703885 RepID=UPI003FD018A2